MPEPRPCGGREHGVTAYGERPAEGNDAFSAPYRFALSQLSTTFAYGKAGTPQADGPNDVKNNPFHRKKS